MLNKAKVWRTIDKLGYTCGTVMIIAFTFLMGRYPNDKLFIFVSFLLPVLILCRFFYYCTLGYHWFLADFCYFTNYAMIYFLWYGTHDQFWFLTCFVFANGPLAFAVMMFRNSLVYHEIDKLTSLSIHAIPMCIMTHIRWYTIPHQANLPANEQRFLAIPEPVDAKEWAIMFLGKPMMFYLIWAVIYYIFNFVIAAKTIKEKNYTTLYSHVQSGYSWIKSPMMFMFLHLLMSFSTVLLATACFQFYWLNIGLNAMYLLYSFWSGGSYYIEAFSRKYWKALEAETRLESQPTSAGRQKE